MSAIPEIQDLSDPTFNPYTMESMAWGDIVDPYPVFAEYRKKGSVHEIEYRKIFTDSVDQTLAHHRHYTVFGYDEVLEVLTKPQDYSSSILEENLGLAFGRTIVVMDPPEHTRYRKLFQQAFLPNIVAKWSEHIVEPVISELIDQFADKGKADLVQDFAIHYPARIIYRQLGLPLEAGRVFHKLAMTQTYWAVRPDLSKEARAKLGDFFSAYIAQKRANPGDDLVSLLATAEVDGEQLPEDVLVSFFRQLINAASDTTYRTTGTLLMCLLKDPAQLEAVRKDRSLIPAAIEEVLRWDGAVTMNWRITTRDVTLGGVDIPAGSVINFIQGSANRDETKFEDPDRYNLFREKRHKHLGLGNGPHVCIGQHLARLEMSRALSAVLDRLPNLRLDPDQPEPFSRGFQLRTPEHLHVRFG
jgi:cytochrome P450